MSGRGLIKIARLIRVRSFTHSVRYFLCLFSVTQNVENA